jgi:plasmid maintenance system antidote protein VapI
MRREGIPWNWFRPGPERDAARLRDKARRAATKEAARALALAARRALAIADRDAEIRRLWGEGWEGKALARRFGLAQSRVSEIVAGLPSRRRYGDPWEVAWPLPRRVVPRPPRRSGLDVPASGETFAGGPMSHKGSAHGRAVLDEPKVARMKRLRLEGWTTGMLAREFGVGRNTVCYIVNGKTWAHVEPAPQTNGGTA